MISLMAPDLKPDIQALEKHLRAVSVLRDAFQNSAALARVQTYITRQLQTFGYATEPHTFTYQKNNYENVIASKLPRATAPRFIIGAHFDAVPGSPGADDNASGVAAMLELARLLAPYPVSQHIDFIAFNLEEYGMIGSCRYAAYLKKQKAKVLGMLSLEMLGFVSHKKGSQNLPLPLKPFYPDTADFVALVGDTGSGKLLKKAQAAFAQIPELPVETLIIPAKGWVFPDTRLSDHSAFWDAGYPALLVTDTSFFRNPYYHTASDKIETLDLDFISKIIAGIACLTLNFIKD